MSSNSSPKPGAECLKAILSYLAVSKQLRLDARARMHEATEQRKGMIAHEQEETARLRIQADCFREEARENTKRVELQCAADVAMIKERRRAFGQLCDTIKAQLHSGDLKLETLGSQFRSLCDVLMTKDFPREDVGVVLKLLQDLMASQDSVIESGKTARLLDNLSPEKYLPQ